MQNTEKESVCFHNERVCLARENILAQELFCTNKKWLVIALSDTWPATNKYDCFN